jgi:hypothetical protein
VTVVARISGAFGHRRWRRCSSSNTPGVVGAIMVPPQAVQLDASRAGNSYSLDLAVAVISVVWAFVSKTPVRVILLCHHTVLLPGRRLYMRRHPAHIKLSVALLLTSVTLSASSAFAQSQAPRPDNRQKDVAPAQGFRFSDSEVTAPEPNPVDQRTRPLPKNPRRTT